MSKQTAYKKPIVFFDGECNFCNSSVDRIVRWDKDKKFSVASLQGSTAKSLLSKAELKDLDSLILFTNTKKYKKTDAVLRIASSLRWYFKPLCLLLALPKCVRDPVYNLLAKNRYKWFGKKETCRLPTKAEESYFLP